MTFSLSPFLSVPVGGYTLQEPPAAVALDFMTRAADPEAVSFYRDFLRDYVHPAPRDADLPDLLKGIGDYFAASPFTPQPPPPQVLQPPLLLLAEVDVVAARYGQDPLDLLQRVSLRCLHLLFWAAKNAEIEALKVSVRLAGGKVDQVKPLQMIGQYLDAAPADKWAEARAAAARRKKLFEGKKNA